MKSLNIGASQLDIIDRVKQLIRGRTNAKGEVSLATGVATVTTVSDDNVAEGDVIHLMPTNSAAAVEMAAGTCYVSSVIRNEFSVTHSASASVRTLKYTVHG